MNEICTQPASERVCVICRSSVETEASSCPEDGGNIIDLLNDHLLGAKFVDTYEIEEILGYGATSTVYKARHLVNGKHYAVKVLHPQLASDQQSLRRFELESWAASSLNHPNVVTVYESGRTEDSIAYYVMDYLTGTTLDQILDSDGRLAVERALNIFVQIADGLARAHDSGILHRDLKPSNIHIHEDDNDCEHAKLLDFGVAKLLIDSHLDPDLSQAGEVCGTPTALSPEQCQGKPLDLRSDIYSMGCLMYETLTGTPPLIGDTVLETMEMHVNQKAKPFEEVLETSTVPWTLSQIVFKCLEKQPADRYQSVKELSLDLKSILAPN